MDLKNAAAICLLSFFSATLVLLIARALDLQGASRLEPQLAKIVEELELLRKQGGIAPASGNAIQGESTDDALVVYYFHSNTRCPTCRAIESQSHETVESGFASELESGSVVWKTVNYEGPAASDLVKKFELQMPVIVLARMKDGQVDDWKRLDQVWALVGDKPAFAEFIRNETSQMLGTTDPQLPTESDNVPTVVPVPNVDPNNISVPTAPGDIPVPE